jgi:hypothetical protein
MAYLDRLGLWGRGTPYADKTRFIDDYFTAGLSSMEQLARDLKQLGVGMARRISYKGVTNERLTHPVTDEQHEIYNEIVRAWQSVLNNFEKAGSEEITGQNNNSRAKGKIASAIWGFQIRFFNNILTTLKMPSVLAHAEDKLAQGESVLFQLVNTDAAPQGKSIEKGLAAGLDFTDIDLTQKQQLIELVEKYFPTQQFVEAVDDDGNVVWRPVQDSEGRPVENPEAVAMRNQLVQNLRDIRIPSGALDMIIQRFGHEKVSEITGRSKQTIINKEGEQEQIKKPSNDVAANRFQNDETQVAVLSGAGLTGLDFHADLREKNQRKRNHYVVQPGW